jgi:3-oxoacyl-(acyl-carrier-protein) synthase/NAD(P)-dependent dehydrogenase (short-subunit alcohol dehydrogenase family)
LDESAVVITGASLGLPGTPRVFDDENVARILRGDQFIDVVPARTRSAMVDKRITRLVKTEDGAPRFDVIDNPAGVIKLAGRAGQLDLTAEFGVPADRVAALDSATSLAIGSGFEALRDAGLPLVLHYKTTSRGTKLPDRWGLPDALRDETGVIFASVFPGLDAFASEMTRYHADRTRREQLRTLEALGTRFEGSDGPERQELDRRIDELRTVIEREPYVFDRRFLLRVLPMGHSQFAELIGARGPNTQVNAACASTTQAVSLAEDWIRLGRCRRVVIVSADNITTDNLFEWFGSGFLASGAAATEDVVEEVALPFDRRRHGMIVGMGAAAIVVESRSAARERGLQPICEVLASVTSNSAFHGTRLNVDHICQVMESLVSNAEKRWGIDRRAIAGQTVFVSHETYTPARGGSASAEVNALRRVFGDKADDIVVANTKGFTGHPMGAGIEDVTAIKALETGLVPPVANFKEVDPELGRLNLSRGGFYPVHYALRLGAGFGSQISMSLIRWMPTPASVRQRPDALGYAYRVIDPGAWQQWLACISDQSAPELEVVQRTLRVRDTGRPSVVSAAAPASSSEVVSAAPAAAPSSEKATVGAAPSGVEATSVKVAAPAIVPRTAPVGAAPTVVSAPEPVMPAPSIPDASSLDSIRETIVALVVEKTGYPADMLDLDLDLEADLGVDTVKQAELLAAIRGIYGIPRDESLKLRDFPTLNHVIKFVLNRRPDLTAAAPAAPTIGAASAVAPAIVDEPAVPTPAVTETVSAESVRDTIVALVVEKTGYPADMLDLDLDLEADLGVDTVKQAELLAAIRGIYSIPRDESLKLRDFPTLNHVIKFVLDRQPRMTSATAAAEADQPAQPRAPVLLSFEAADSVPRRVPVPTLRLSTQACRPTGIALQRGTRVVIASDTGGVAEALAERLSGRGVEMLVVDTTVDADALTNRLAKWTVEGPIDGLFWLPALDAEGDLRTFTTETWRKALHARVKLLSAAARTLYERFGAPGTFLVAATRLGGQHGYDAEGAFAPLGGAVTGFIKALHHERPKTIIKAVDFASDADPTFVADRLIDEARRDPAVVEIGYKNGLRWTVGLAEIAAPAAPAGLRLSRDSVFLITGAAGSIVSAITADLAAATGGKFYLLDRVPEPDPANRDIGRLKSDKDGLKRDIAERLKARGDKATPALVERELATLERAEAALAAIDAISSAGGVARYLSVDLTDASSVARAIDVVRKEAGRIDVLVHAAGIDTSHFLPDKKPAEFDLVFDVKSDGWFHLLHAIGDLPLGAAVVFSSIAARFGNAGQTDYAAANDLLCKLTSSFRRTRPETRAVAIDWTAWRDIGMASRGSIPKMMEQAGIEMLPPEAGIPVVRRELTRAAGSGEVVIALGLGVLLQDADADGGVAPHEVAAAHAEGVGPMIGAVTSMKGNVLTVETTLDPTEQPFLKDHQIDGTPVLPGVIGIEAFAEVAAFAAPGWVVASVEEITFAAPFKFYRHQPRTLRVDARFRADAHDLLAECRLIGTRVLPGQPEPQETVHFTGRVRLVRVPIDLGVAPVPPESDVAIDAQDIYRIYFHGPAYQVLEKLWRTHEGPVGLMSCRLPANHVPTDRPTIMLPRLIEACFQTAGIWEIEASGRMGLPHTIERVSACPVVDAPAGPLFAIDRPDTAKGTFDAVVVDSSGRVLVRLQGYRTAEVPGAIDRQLLRDALARFEVAVVS